MNGQRALLEVRGLRKSFPVRGGWFGRVVGRTAAVDGVDLDIARGKTLGLVGGSGSGKTTIGRCILRLIEADAGSVVLDGTDVRALRGARLRHFRRRMQIVFQDPYGSLNPRLTVGAALDEALRVHALGDRTERARRVASILERVGLSPEHADRYPHEFSGGQRQRIGIARALVVGPEFLVADEPVSALDVSVQAQVLNLLADLRDELSLTMLFIAHDLAVVAQVCDEIAVLDRGRVVESGPTDRVLSRPEHPVTRGLLESVPRLSE